MRTDWNHGITAKRLYEAEIADVNRCWAEPWPFTWTPPGPPPDGHCAQVERSWLTASSRADLALERQAAGRVVRGLHPDLILVDDVDEIGYSLEPPAGSRAWRRRNGYLT